MLYFAQCCINVNQLLMLKIQLFVYKCNFVAIFWLQSIDAVLGSFSVDVNHPILLFPPVRFHTTDTCNGTTEGILFVRCCVAIVFRFGLFQNFVSCGTLWDVFDCYWFGVCFVHVCHVENKLHNNCYYLKNKSYSDIDEILSFCVE